MTVNNEVKRLWKEGAVTNLKYYAGISLEGLRKTTKESYRDSNLAVRSVQYYHARILVSQVASSVSCLKHAVA
jgi:hypothetical protein